MWKMFSPRLNLFLLCFMLVTIIAHSVRHGLIPPSNLPRLTGLFPRLPFNTAFADYYGSKNIESTDNGSFVTIKLDNSSGSGFKSRDMYYYGFFSTAIKLPSIYSAGVVVAFYMSNSEQYPKNHDEIDFELLGHEKQKEWVLQTNMYGNGSTGTGREEKFNLWFDPTEEFHEYSILWNSNHTVFLVDNIPVREASHTTAMAAAYPSKPMSTYATIWDGSEWATHGGKKPIDYKFAPFTASFKDMEISGCINNNPATSSCNVKGHSIHDPVEGQEFTSLSKEQKIGMDWVRGKFMFYSYCKDLKRYPVVPPECKVTSTIQNL